MILLPTSEGSDRIESKSIDTTLLPDMRELKVWHHKKNVSTAFRQAIFSPRFNNPFCAFRLQSNKKRQ